MSDQLPGFDDITVTYKPGAVTIIIHTRADMVRAMSGFRITGPTWRTLYEAMQAALPKGNDTNV